jgi:DNA-binding transcriptional ArsR family regulator
LASPWRRAILDLLRERPRTTGDLVEHLGESRFLVLQHLRVLREADLVITTPQGRQRVNHLNAVPIQQIHERWVSKYEGAWAQALIGLRDALEPPPDVGASEEGREVG